MQQPLAHLYFQTVLEHLMNEYKTQTLSDIVITSNLISQYCDSPEIDDKDKVLLWIEHQAVVQIIAWMLPDYLDLSKIVKVQELGELKDSINK